MRGAGKDCKRCITTYIAVQYAYLKPFEKFTCIGAVINLLKCFCRVLSPKL